MPRNPTAPLSRGELAALRLAAGGYTSRQIAHRLETTEQGIHLRLKSAATKLGARSRTHAVVIALKRKLIWLDELEGNEVPPAPLEASVSAPQVDRGHREPPTSQRAPQRRTAA